MFFTVESLDLSVMDTDQCACDESGYIYTTGECNSHLIELLCFSYYIYVIAEQ